MAIPSYVKGKTVGLQYSNDGGSTWSTAVVLVVSSWDVYDFTETDIDVADGTKRKWETRATYKNVNLTFFPEQFNPASPTFTDGATRWQDVQDWCAAALRRIYNADTTNYPLMDGHDEFNSSSNTNYVNLLNMELINDEMGAQNSATPEYTRTFMLELQTRDVI